MDTKRPYFLSSPINNNFDIRERYDVAIQTPSVFRKDDFNYDFIRAFLNFIKLVGKNVLIFVEYKLDSYVKY
jgi:hypothetical protein